MASASVHSKVAVLTMCVHCLLLLQLSMGFCFGSLPYLALVTSWLSFAVSAVSLSLSHWYSGSAVVFDCIDS